VRKRDRDRGREREREGKGGRRGGRHGGTEARRQGDRGEREECLTVIAREKERVRVRQSSRGERETESVGEIFPLKFGSERKKE